MPPNSQQDEEPTQDQIDERICGEKVNYWLNKMGCTLHGQAILENGSVIVRVGIMKIPAEIRKKMKEQAGNATPAAPLATPPINPPAPS